MSNTKAEDKSLALVEVTSGMQLRVSTLSKDGQSIDVGVSLTRVNAQHIANALLEYAGIHVRSADRRHKTTVLAYYDPAFEETLVVHLADKVSRGGRGK